MTAFYRLWLISLLFVVGGIRGRASTNRFESEVQALEAVAKRDPAPTGAVMLYGSSSFRLWTNAAAQFPGHDIVNRGFGGAHLSDLNEFFERLVVPASPSLLLIYGGDNDLASGKTPERVLADFLELIRLVRNYLPQTRVAFVAIKPSPSRVSFLEVQREANRRVRSEARSLRQVDYLDVASPLMGPDGKPDESFFLHDRLHLNGAGYERWSRVLGPYVDRWDPKRPAPARAP